MKIINRLNLSSKSILNYLIILMFFCSCNNHRNLIKFNKLPKQQKEELESISNNILIKILETESLSNRLKLIKRNSYMKIEDVHLIVDSLNQDSYNINYDKRIILSYVYNINNYHIIYQPVPITTSGKLDTLNSEIFYESASIIKVLEKGPYQDIEEVVRLSKLNGIKSIKTIFVIKNEGKHYWTIISKKNEGILINVLDHKEILKMEKELYDHYTGA